MNLLSIFAGLCAFSACAFVGLWLKRRLVSKAEFYEDYYTYLLFASEKIGYERMPIGELNQAFFTKCDRAFSSFLRGENPAISLSDGEIKEVEDYLAQIGTTDADTQIASLKGKCAEMKRYAEGDCVKFRKDGALYFKLGVLLGLVAFILLA